VEEARDEHGFAAVPQEEVLADLDPRFIQMKVTAVSPQQPVSVNAPS